MRIVIAMPRRNNQCDFGAARAFCLPLEPGSKHTIIPISPRGSLLSCIFNVAWGAALDAWEAGKADGFAMGHDDVECDPGTYSILADELERSGADILSVVVPIRGDEGVTSTALDNVTADPWKPQRLTMTETLKLPETFTEKDVGAPLLLNTGLWICKFGPWATTPTDLVFTVQDAIEKRNGKRHTRVFPEDWNFSRQARERGAKLAATRKIKVLHHGDQAWPNFMAWGWEHDEVNGPYAKPEEEQEQ